MLTCGAVSASHRVRLHVPLEAPAPHRSVARGFPTCLRICEEGRQLKISLAGPDTRLSSIW